VSGDENIRPSDDVLRRSGRRVRFDNEVRDVAADELRAGGRFVVVAHGRSDGTVLWFCSKRGNASRWLWVGMPNPPQNTRIYLYACLAGIRLPRFLRRCEAFGHSDEIPMPTGGAQEVVLRYFDEVDRLMRHNEAITDWRVVLGLYVNEAYAEEVERPTGLLSAAALLMLRRSLGYFDE
jgi:hypothetical protein